MALIEDGNNLALKKYFNEHIMPINEELSKELDNYQQIEHIRVPLIKARIIELINSVSLLPNVELEIGVENIIDDISAKEIDLFTIINIFINNAVEEVSSHEKANIKVYLDKTTDVFVFEINNSLKDGKSTPKPQNTHKGFEIISKILVTYSPRASFFSYNELNAYIQYLEVKNA